MRKYRWFSKPTKVADVLQEDLNTDISSSLKEKERLQQRRWYNREKAHNRLFTRKAVPHRRQSWRQHGRFGQMLET